MGAPQKFQLCTNRCASPGVEREPLLPVARQRPIPSEQPTLRGHPVAYLRDAKAQAVELADHLVGRSAGYRRRSNGIG
jgi:hypothetical protein